MAIYLSRRGKIVAPVEWWTCLKKTMPHEAEAGGGLMVAIIQLATMLGAIVDGAQFAHCGYYGPFNFATAIPVIVSQQAFVSSRVGTVPHFIGQLT